MYNNTKWLSFQSFSRNQSLSTAINTLCAFIKLDINNENDIFTKKDIDEAKQILIEFLKKIELILNEFDGANKNSALYGLDPKLKSFFQNFAEARKKQSNYNSKLFRQSPSKIIELLSKLSKESYADLLKSLYDLEILVESQLTEDSIEIIGEI